MDSASEHNAPDWMGRSRVEAERMGHHFIAPEHIFLAWAHSKEAKLPALLAELGCSIEEMVQIIERIMEHADSGRPGKNIPLTRSAEEMLKQTYLESRSRKAEAIEERDVILGMLQDRKGVLSIVMKQRWDVGYEEVRAIL